MALRTAGGRLWSVARGTSNAVSRNFPNASSTGVRRCGPLLSTHKRVFSTMHSKNDLLHSYPSIEANQKPTMTIKGFKAKFKSIEKGCRLREEEEVVLCGRVVAKPREASKKLFFLHIRSEWEAVQIVSEAQSFNLSSISQEASIDEFASLLRHLREGDILSVRGFPGKTKRDELSLIATELRVLAPCVADIPSGRGDGKFALTDKKIRYRHRHVDLLANVDESVKPFRIRAGVISFLRNYLDREGFMEVETPIISGTAGGALAQPFKTKAKITGDADLALRIAPELFLKKLVIGGIDKVYEIGKVFRNEGVGPNHNPEFTSCEFYWAYKDYEDLMHFTETLLRTMAQEVIGTTKLPNGADLEMPFKRLPVVPALEAAYNLRPGSFPDVNNINLVDETGEELLRLLEKRHRGSTATYRKHIPQHTVATNCKILDDMIGRDLEIQCTQPTFICDHPIAMSPLAKEHPNRKGASQRFELFINQKEVVNAYTELNDPEEQLQRFKHQLNGRELQASAEVDVMPVDADFCKALEYGLPPTAGWGMGLDRVAMMFAGKSSIRDVIFFPMLSPKELEK